MSIVSAIETLAKKEARDFIYHAEGEVNDLVARLDFITEEDVVAIMFLLTNGNISLQNGRASERLNVALWFATRSDFDFDAKALDDRIEMCSRAARRWLLRACGQEGAAEGLRVVSVNSGERVYNRQTDLLCGYVLNLTIEGEAVAVCPPP